MIKLRHLWLEVTNRCNGNCVFCARKWALPPQDMELDLFKRIIDECPEAKIVQTQGFGEPLMYPYIVEAIKYAAKKGKETVFYTNGSLLTEEMSRELIYAGLSRIIFSVDDMTKKGYEAVRPGLSWDRLLENIRVFSSIRQKAHRERGQPRKRKPHTMVRMCETPENSGRVGWCKAFWRKRVDDVSSRREVDVPSPMELRAKPYVEGAPITDCPFLHEYLSVKSNGDLVICCRDWFNVYVGANLHNQNVQEAYRNAMFEAFRESHRTGVNLPYLCHICKTNRPPARYKK